MQIPLINLFHPIYVFFKPLMILFYLMFLFPLSIVDPRPKNKTPKLNTHVICAYSRWGLNCSPNN